MSGVVTAEREGGICTITLDRPDHRNALTGVMLRGLTDLLQQTTDDPAIRLVVLRGRGRDFCTGIDLDEFYSAATAGPDEHAARALAVGDLLRAVYGHPKPVVAVVAGRALGVGATLAIACDIVFASTTAQFAFPEVTYGFVPAFGAVVLTRIVGRQAAFELAASGRTLRAEEAKALGLVSRLIPDEGFDAVTTSALRGLGNSAEDSLQHVKEAFRAIEGVSLAAALKAAEAMNARAHAARAFQEAARQFGSMA